MILQRLLTIGITAIVTLLLLQRLLTTCYNYFITYWNAYFHLLQRLLTVAIDSIPMTLNRCHSIYFDSFVILLQRFINYNTIYTHHKTKSFINNLIIQNMQQASNLNPKVKCNQVQND